MTTLLTVIHVIVCVFLVAVVLLQSGRSGGMGVLSGGTTQTVFGGRGAGGFLTRATSICATIFILTSASLAYTSSSSRDSLSRGSRRPASTAPARAPTKVSPAMPNTPSTPTAPSAPAAPSAPVAPAVPVVPGTLPGTLPGADAAAAMR